MSPTNRIALLATLVASIVAYGCSSVPEDVLATIGGDSLRVAEYERMFLRTRLGPPKVDSEKPDFLETLVDFHVKQKEAEARGYHNEPAFQQEYQQYRNDLAVNFLYERDFIEPAVRTLFDRRQEEIKLQQLLVKWVPGEGGDGVDTIQTYEKARVIQAIVNAHPEDFDSLVMEFSDDGGKSRTRGFIGWFIAGTSFPQLDDMMYALPQGGITPHLLRTVFGYHLFRVMDRKPARLRLRPAHILHRLDLDNPNDTTAAFEHLSRILDTLQQGLAGFGELAQRNSQDSSTAAIGGDLGWMNRGTNIEPHFEEAIFSLNVGEVSRPIRTPYAMHLVKILAEEPALPFAEQRENLRRVYRKERFNTDFLNYFARLRTENNFTVQRNVVDRIISRMTADMTTSTPGWDQRLTQDDRAAYLLRTDVGPISVDVAVSFMKKESTVQMRPFTVAMFDTVAMMLADQQLALARCANFENDVPEFRRLLDEYRATALVTRLEEEAVWKAIDIPEAEVMDWWKRNSDAFVLPARVRFAEIYTYTQRMADIYLDSLRSGKDFLEMAGRYTQRPGYFQRKGVWDFVDVNANDLSRAAHENEVGAIVGPIQYQTGFSVIKVLDKHPAREMTWDEAKPSATARLKEIRAAEYRQQWVATLRDKFGVELYPEHLDNAFPPVPEGK